MSEEDNREGPETETPSSPPEETEPVYARFGVRMTAGVIDTLLAILFILVPLMFFANVIYGEHNPQLIMQEIQAHYADKISRYTELPSAERQALLQNIFTDYMTHMLDPAVLTRVFINYLLQFVITMTVVVSFWYYKLATPGKMLMGLTVLRASDFGRPGLPAMIIRFIGYVPSLFLLGLGFIAIFWNKRNQGWHDRMAGTVVVRTGQGLEQWIPKKVLYSIYGALFLLGIAMDRTRLLTLAIAVMLIFIHFSKKLENAKTDDIKKKFDKDK